MAEGQLNIDSAAAKTAVYELGNSRLDTVSPGNRSRASLSPATGLSTIQYQQPVEEDELRGESLEKEEEEEEEEEKDEVVQEEEEGGEGAVQDVGRKNESLPCEEVPSETDIVPAQISSTTSPCDGVRSLLENVPRISEEFEVVSKIGEGTFSSVYLGRLKGCGGGGSEMKFALKHLVPTSASLRIENELKCLQSMGGRDNVIPLLTSLRHKDHIVLIMPYFPHTKLTDYLYQMTPGEVQRYMRALFTALCNVHSHHIIHRDIKPSNFLYDRMSGRFQLVDFGLAHLETSRLPQHSSSTSVSSSVQSKTQLSRSSRASTRQTLATPPTSSSTHTVTNHQQRPHPNVLVNGTASFLPPHPPPKTITATTTTTTNTYRRQVHRKLHPQSITTATDHRGGGGGGGGGRVTGRRAGRKRVKVEEEKAGEDCVCPLRHKNTEVCDVCQNKPQQNAPRAGTPGFRAPEVLLKCPNQTTAVDVWSAGVIFLCLLSGHYPFFRASDDLTALAQIVALMGSAACTRMSRELGKELVVSDEITPVNLRQLCQDLRNQLHNQILQIDSTPSSITATLTELAQPPSKRKKTTSSAPPPPPSLSGTSPSCRYELRSPRVRKSPQNTATPQSFRVNRQHISSPPPLSSSSSSTSATSLHGPQVVKLWEGLPDSAYDLLECCLELSPGQRITAREALCHPFLASVVR